MLSTLLRGISVVLRPTTPVLMTTRRLVSAISDLNRSIAQNPTQSWLVHLDALYLVERHLGCIATNYTSLDDDAPVGQRHLRSESFHSPESYPELARSPGCSLPC